MKLVENWKGVLAGAWSIYALVISSLLSMAAVFLGLVDAKALGLDPVFFAVLASVASALGVVARIVQQVTIRELLSRFRRDASGAVRRGVMITMATASIGGAAAFVAPWEGLRTTAYIDAVGVETVCYGHTRGVKLGDTYTPAECKELLRVELQQFAANLGRCLKVRLPEGAAVAFLSWSYNVGTGAACSSTLVRKANAGDLRGACDELLRWDKGRINGELQRIRGLTNRREAEHSLCLQSLEPLRPWRALFS
ncbi:lysozyme [Leisingera daeponensis]|uniref:Lysozyme n=1 Tax=Leisingera daeponensis TaxID=405746 RepID=A0ABS7NJV8_9RHOB|nr:lysozyme [Leisingera daeponensis]MBY6141112.1 lysozyme [Leisingera daeponensis]